MGKRCASLNPRIQAWSRNNSKACGSGSGHPCPTILFLRFLALLATLVATIFALHRRDVRTSYLRGLLEHVARDSKCR
jgi:hypothetical protein